ncbi:MAG: sensor histidine kinase [Opitutaceae bacterium]
MRDTIIESTLPLTSDNVYSEIQRDLLQPVFIASLMAHDTFLRDWAINGEQDEDSITRYLHELKVKYGTVSSFFVSDQTLKYYHAHGLLKTISPDEPRDEWYFRVKDMTKRYEINVDPDLANADEMTIFINYRTFNYDGEFIGATGVGLTVNSVNNLISRYEAKFDRQIYFTNAEGKIVLRPTNSPLLEYQTLQEIEGLESVSAKLLSNKQTQVTYNRDGETRMLHCRYVPELHWYLIVEQSESTALAPIREQLLINIGLAILVTLTVAMICIAAIKRQQAKLERRNDELLCINAESEAQKHKISLTAKELEAANQSLSALNKDKDEFIGIIAHDLRNPLNSIIGFCELALEEPKEIDITPFIGDIKDSGERMLELTQKLLDVSQIEAFQGEIEKEDTDWNAIIEVSAHRFAGQAQEKKITFEYQLDATTGIIVQSRPDWLDICMSNLISNAIKYTPRCGKVFIQSRKIENRLEFEIKDTGPGISEDDQHRMFGKFVRLTAQPTGNESSTGLGLYIVKSMCDRLNLNIKVRSELGHGTSFTVTQPLD